MHNIVLILEDLHSQGIIHRDIKSENFLVAENGYLKLTDFGNSKDNIHSRQRAYTLVGTNQFMAPEVIQDELADFKSDVWSLGVILYALISSGVPFCGENRDETAR